MIVFNKNQIYDILHKDEYFEYVYHGDKLVFEKVFTKKLREGIVVYYDSVKGVKKAAKIEKIPRIDLERYIPIGIVVTPFGSERHLMMSLPVMITNNPTVGTNTKVEGFGNDNKAHMTWGPSLNISGITNINNESEALQDFNGREWTSKAISARGSRDYSTWTPNDNNATGTYPAASCCDMFFTPGTEQQSWYLPSVGELNYVRQNYELIEYVLDVLISFDVFACKLYDNDGLNDDGEYWTSTNGTHNLAIGAGAWRMKVMSNTMSREYKATSRYLVRAFHEINVSEFDTSFVYPMPKVRKVSEQIVFANKETGQLFMTSGEISSEKLPPSKYEPIGVVVIPIEHGVLKDGSGTIPQYGIMSLKVMSCDTPETGTLDNKNTMLWGGGGVDIENKEDGLGRYDSVTNGLFNYDYVSYDKTPYTNKITGYGKNYAYLIVQKEVGQPPVYDSKPSYDRYIPSPYKGEDFKSGDFNPEYTKFFSHPDYTLNSNPCSDFGGIVNTKILTDLATEQDDWRTSDTIVMSGGVGYHPAACCCARYKTVGTKAFVDCSNDELKNGNGFWYFPAIGELCYISPRLADINDTISKLNDIYGNCTIINTGSTWMESSTEYDKDWCRIFNVYVDYSTQSGADCDYRDKTHTAHGIRAFIRLNESDVTII